MTEEKHLAFCSSCGESLSGCEGPSPEERAPCPKCGSTLRHYFDEFIDSIKLSGGYSELASREGIEKGYSEERFDGRRTAAEFNEDDSLTTKIEGPSPQGEELTLAACRIFISSLNSLGANWQEPEFVNDGIIDCVAVDRNDHLKKISIQCVKGNIRQDIWKKRASNGSYENSENIQETADRIREAIEKKADNILPAIRNDISLALDAALLPGLCFSSVISRLKEQHGEWIKQLGFQSVWIVGPEISLTKRLDR